MFVNFQHNKLFIGTVLGCVVFALAYFLEKKNTAISLNTLMIRENTLSSSINQIRDLEDNIDSIHHVKELSTKERGEEDIDLDWDSIEDSTPPELIEFSIAPSTVYSGRKQSKLSFDITLTDDVSGVDVTEFNISLFNKSFQLISTTKTLKSVDEKEYFNDVELSYEVLLPPFLKPGHYDLTVSVSDHLGNSDVLNCLQLKNFGFPCEIEVVSSIIDSIAPELIDLSLDKRQIDQFQGTSIVANVSMSDDNPLKLNGKLLGEITLNHQEFDVNLSIPLFVDDSIYTDTDGGTSGSGLMVLSEYRVPGTYSISVELKDALGNIQQYTPNQLSEIGIPSEMIITGDSLDNEPPKINSFLLSPRLVNSKTPEPILVNLEIEDKLSGVNFTSLQLTFRNSVTNHQFSPKTIPFIVNDSALLQSKFLFDIPQNSPTGDYLVLIEVTDMAGNRLMTEQPSKERMNSLIPVISID